MHNNYQLTKLSKTTWLVFYDSDACYNFAAVLDKYVASATHALVEWIAGDGSLMLLTRNSVDEDWVRHFLTQLVSSIAKENSRVHQVEVDFSGPDLEIVAKHFSLDEETYISRFCSVRYEVRFMGFAPGFGYLKGGEGSDLPRRQKPRTRMKAGAVAVAAGYTCIYPVASPGGWNWIGNTTVSLFNKSASDEDMFLFAPFDHVIFKVL